MTQLESSSVAAISGSKVVEQSKVVVFEKGQEVEFQIKESSRSQGRQYTKEWLRTGKIVSLNDGKFVTIQGADNGLYNRSRDEIAPVRMVCVVNVAFLDSHRRKYNGEVIVKASRRETFYRALYCELAGKIENLIRSSRGDLGFTHGMNVVKGLQGIILAGKRTIGEYQIQDVREVA